MIIAASEQMTELLEELGLAARIAGERYEPVLAEVDTLELARAAVPDADGTGTTVTTDPPTVQRSLAALARLRAQARRRPVGGAARRRGRR